MQSIDLNTEMKAECAAAGYDSYVFMDQSTLIERVRQAAPHVVLFSPEALLSPLSDFVARVLEISSEIQLICVGGGSQTQALQEYRPYNLEAVVPEGLYMVMRAIWALDSVCEKLFRVYQNEQLLLQNEQVESTVSELKQKNIEQKRELSALEEYKKQAHQSSVREKINAYQKALAKDDFVQTFLEQLPCNAIYFKWLPSVVSFVATCSKGLDIESLKGVGSRMTLEESRSVNEFLESGKLPEALNELMQAGLNIKNYFSQLIPVYHGFDGLIVFWGDENFHFEQIENDFLVFRMLYQQAHLIKRSEQLDIYDPVTELYNRNYFYQKLDEEVARARRLRKPVAVIRMAVDHFIELEQVFGKNNRDLILRTIASIIKRSSRVNDYSCRTAENEFSLVLPHCHRRGAALRAERLRRIIENHSFSIGDAKITVACGVSEYPTLCPGASELDASAGQALDFMIGKGGNKVCLFKPTESFNPDFQVSTID